MWLSTKEIEMARHSECDCCEREFQLNNDMFYIEKYDKKFCSESCMKRWVKENILDDVINEWLDENAYEGKIEDEDPWARYGVSVNDFI